MIDLHWYATINNHAITAPSTSNTNKICRLSNESARTPPMFENTALGMRRRATSIEIEVREMDCCDEWICSMADIDATYVNHLS